jgi:hypothetical protein
VRGDGRWAAGWLYPGELAGQNPDRQLEGVEVDTVFSDTVSGKSIQRPSWRRCCGSSAPATSWSCIRWTGWPAISMISVDWCAS